MRNEIFKKFNEFEDYFVVDSMPLEVVKLSRSRRSKICKEEYYTFPNKGYLSVDYQLDFV